MTNPISNGEKKASVQTTPRNLLPLPGLAAISLYLLMLAGVIIVGVTAGRHYPPLFLLFAAVFIAASAGLLMLLRWAWALALAAVFLLVIYNMWIFTSQHQYPALVQSLLNLVFFLYLVRPEVRDRLR
jgi:glycerol-3-phosphate acyltransferase PlsY